jgi:hypothetical protein
MVSPYPKHQASGLAGRMKQYLLRVGDATSQWLNVVLLLGANPNESISGRSYRLRRCAGWKYARVCIDALFSPFEKDHCKASYDADLMRAETLLATRGIVECDN